MTTAAAMERGNRIGDPVADTRVREEVDGRYVGTIPSSWQIAFSQDGSTLIAALQAARRVVRDESLELISTSAVFTKPTRSCSPSYRGAPMR